MKRAFRIWPALIVFTLGVALVAGPILSVLPAGEYFRNPATWQYLGAIGFYISYGLPGVFADVPYAGVVNGSLWTMPLEVALYVLVPLVLWLVSRRPWRTACLPAHGHFCGAVRGGGGAAVRGVPPVAYGDLWPGCGAVPGAGGGRTCWACSMPCPRYGGF